LALPYRWQWRVEKWKSAMRGFFGGGEQQPRPKICPACGALVGINTTRCHECGANLRFSLAALSKGLSGLFGGNAPVTTVLLVANVLMFGVTLMRTMSEGGGGGLSGSERTSRFQADCGFGGAWSPPCFCMGA
jgi:hypothetical protein